MLKDYLRRKLINWIVKDLFCGITSNDILQIKGSGSVTYKGKTLNNEQWQLIKEDADKFHQSVIWKMLSDDAKYHANYLMYENSRDFGGMMFGKAVLYAVDVIEQRLKQIAES